MIRAVLFDLDETLILDHAVSLHTLRDCAYFAAAWYALDADALARGAESHAKRLWKTSPVAAYADRIGHSAGEGLWARYEVRPQPEIAALAAWAPGYRAAVWRDALAEQGVSDEALCEALAHRYFAGRRLYPRFAEVDRLLAELSGTYRLGIVTNGVPDLQRDKLEGCGLGSWFGAVAVSGEVNVGKPQPGIFAYVCDELGVEPAECVMVGDNPERDVAGAIAAGMKSVWVERGFKDKDPRYPADLEVKDLLEMLPWLEALS